MPWGSLQIDVLSTTFVRVNNKVMIVPNHKLYGQCIENLCVCVTQAAFFGAATVLWLFQYMPAANDRLQPRIRSSWLCQR